MKALYKMVLLTPRQFIAEFKTYDTIILGATDINNTIGLSNDFYVSKILNEVKKELNIFVAARPINRDRTLWVVSTRPIEELEISHARV